MKQPEELARKQIDQLLPDAGWMLQDRSEFDPKYGSFVAMNG
ncbi:hypothetical protein [Pusillimonas sp. MFBS29]|nr:hypothetical protein [Pusillimonas sp. MFBS29]